MKKINLNQSKLTLKILIPLSIIFIPIFGSLLNLFFVTSNEYQIRAIKNFISLIYLSIYIILIIVIYKKWKIQHKRTLLIW